jgi:hypothetical protein
MKVGKVYQRVRAGRTTARDMTEGMLRGDEVVRLLSIDAGLDQRGVAIQDMLGQVHTLPHSDFSRRYIQVKGFFQKQQQTLFLDDGTLVLEKPWREVPKVTLEITSSADTLFSITIL